ncbi:MAG: ATP-grasp fold amidoligase family protein [Saccharospirillum sp.]
MYNFLKGNILSHLRFLIKKYRYEVLKRFMFYRVHGYLLDLSSPKSFNEKVFYRKYKGNYDYMALIADKYRVREYVASKVGDEYLIPLVGIFKKITIKDWEDFPEQFVIKTNHGSGVEHIQIVSEKKSEDPVQVVRKINKALNDDFGVIGHQPFYQKIDRLVLVEKYLDAGAVTPDDYKFHCFGDRIFIQVDRGRYDHHYRNIYDENWNLMPFKINSNYPNFIENIPKPKNFNKMISVARKLSEDFDYIRVDLYNIDGCIYFGELTQTPGNGRVNFNPTCVDFEWGEYWNLQKENKWLYK